MRWKTKSTILTTFPFLALALLLTPTLSAQPAPAPVEPIPPQLQRRLAAPVQIGAKRVTTISPSSAIQTNIRGQQVFVKDGKVEIELEIPIPGKRMTKTYTVRVPIVTNGVTQYRTEQRVRSVPATEKKRVPAADLFEFADLDGKPLNNDEVVKRIGGDSGYVILSVAKKTPPFWNAVLKADTVLMLRKQAKVEP